MSGDEDAPELDDLTKPTPAVFVMPDEAWRELVARSTPEQLEQLRRGELRFRGLADDGGADVPIVAPDWLLAELDAR